jgi:hypothetical protein
MAFMVLISAAGVALAGTLPPGGTFIDDDGNAHEANIEAIVAEGITFGCDAEGPRYCPDDFVTRAQMASFLARALDLPASKTNFFADDNGSVHEDNINRVAEAGITVGCAPVLYCPNEFVTRAQMASFLARALGLSASATDFFTDDGDNTHEDNINRVAEAGITVGCAPVLYCPDEFVTRAQMASFLARALGLEPMVPPPRPITVDVMVVFTEQARVGVINSCDETPVFVCLDIDPSEPASLAQYYVDETTFLFQSAAPPVVGVVGQEELGDSEIAVEFRLVHTAVLPYDESDDIFVDMDRLKDPADGFLDEVFDLRLAHNADLVVLLVSGFSNGPKGVVGVAGAVGYPDPSFKDNAFAVYEVISYNDLAGEDPLHVAIGWAFAHEVGHLLGSTHPPTTAAQNVSAINELAPFVAQLSEIQ